MLHYQVCIQLLQPAILSSYNYRLTTSKFGQVLEAPGPGASKKVTWMSSMISQRTWPESHDIREVHLLYSVVLNRCGHWGLLSAASVDAHWDWNLSTARICCCAPCCSVSGRRHRQLLRHGTQQQTRRSGVRTKGRKNGLPKVPTDSYRPCYGPKQF